MGIWCEKIVWSKFKGLKKVFLVEKKIDKNDFEKSSHFEGNLEKIYILIFFFYDGFP